MCVCVVGGSCAQLRPGARRHTARARRAAPPTALPPAAGKAELKGLLQKYSARPFTERIADFHLLLWLARQPNFEAPDMAVIVDAVKARAPLGEGYRLIIESLAGL